MSLLHRRLRPLQGLTALTFLSLNVHFSERVREYGHSRGALELNELSTLVCVCACVCARFVCVCVCTCMIESTVLEDRAQDRRVLGVTAFGLCW